MTTTIALAPLALALLAQFGPGEPSVAPGPPPATKPAPTAASTGDDPGPAAAPTSAPADDSSPVRRRPLGGVDDAPGGAAGPLQLRTCHDLLADAPAAAASCYREAALRAERGRDVRVATELARLADEVAAHQARELAPAPTGDDDLGAMVTSGKAELVLWSGAYGLYLGGLAVVTGMMLIAELPSLGVGLGLGAIAALTTGALLFPVATGAGAMTLAAVASAGLDELSSGDANLIRSALWLGAFDAVASVVLAAGTSLFPQDLPVLYPASMLLVSSLVPGAAIAAATVVDLPDGGVATATSAALWSGVLALLGLFATGVPLEFAPSLLLVAGSANVAWLAGLLASPWIPLSRPETWALDLGAALGLAASAALAIALNAPNPALGFGAMMAGTVAGGALGLGAAYFGRRALEGLTLPELPQLVAVGPALLPTQQPAQPAVGAGLTLRF